MVVFHHMVDYTSSAVIHNRFFTYSNLFVDFFFVLSGFVISYSYPSFQNSQDLRHFHRKRFWRLYPLHLILLLVFAVFEFAKYYASSFITFNGGAFKENNLGSFIVSALLLNSIKWPFTHALSWNYQSWSISAEMISYFFYSFVVFGLVKVGRRAYRTVSFLGAILIGFALLYLIQGNFNLILTYDYGFLRGLIGFSTGVLCFTVFDAVYEKAKAIPAFVFTLLECLAFLLTFILIWNWEVFKPHGYVYEVLFFFSILTFAFEKGGVSRLLTRVPFFLSLGTYSYSIYMNHAIIGILFNVLFIRILKFPDTAYAYLFVLDFAIVYIVSKWTFAHVELYFQKRFGQRPKSLVAGHYRKSVS